MKHREVWLDQLKAVSICLVVLGHNHAFTAHAADWNQVLGIIRMPLFFCLAGVLLARMNWAKILQRSASLIWSYWLVGLLLLPMAMRSADAPAWLNSLKGLAYGASISILVSPSWFLLTLALTLPLAYAIHAHLLRNLPGRLAPRLVLPGCALLCLGLGAMLIFNQEPALHNKSLAWLNREAFGVLPWGADLSLLAAGYVLLGAAIHESSRALSRRTLLLVAAASLALFLIFYDSSIRIVLASGAFRPLLPALICSLAAVIGSIALARALWLREIGLFALAGRATLPILVLHDPIQRRIGQLGLMQAQPLLSGISGFLLAVLLPVLLDFLLRRYLAWQLIFYPRDFFRAFMAWRKSSPRCATP